MKKKAKQVQRKPKPDPNAKGKVVEPQSPSDRIGRVPVPASPSSAWLEMMQQQAAPEERIIRREAGPGMPYQYEQPTPRLTGAGTAPGVLVVQGVCEGCLEQITQPSDHEWWCPWWDTVEGKAVVPF